MIRQSSKKDHDEVITRDNATLVGKKRERKR
jgi:hypothetical protein